MKGSGCCWCHEVGAIFMLKLKASLFDCLTVVTWPPQSPRLSPEQCRAVVERNIHFKDVQLTNLEKLCDAVIKI